MIVAPFRSHRLLFLFLLLSFPLAAQSQTNLYVDCGWGSNTWDGLTAVYTNGHGPKLNVSNTIVVATSGDTLRVAPGFYQEFTWNPGMNILTIIPSGIVTIYDKNPATTDSDGDGMVDRWEARYGLDGLNPADAAGDADSDSISNYDEYVQGTDPTNPDITAPTLTVSVSPSPNANGWNTNNVTVHFSASDSGGSGIAYVTPDVTVTNETVDQQVQGVAIDVAGNQTLTNVFIDIDTNVPSLTGSPADGDVVNQLRPPFVIEYTDTLSGVDTNSLVVTLDGTNVTANFQAFASGAIWTPTNDLAVCQHGWTISVVDLAGNTNLASASFQVVNLGTNGVGLSDFNIFPDQEPGATGVTTMPDEPSMWVQGIRSSSNAQVTAAVNFGEPMPASVRGSQFGWIVPLDPGPNIILFTASDGSTNTASYAFEVIRSTRYRAAITSPEFGTFANGEAQVVTGYVSAKKDEGLPSEEPADYVTVNGVACTLGSVDANSNRSFTTYPYTVPVPTNNSFQALVVTIVWPSTNTITLGSVDGYEVTYKNKTFGQTSANLVFYGTDTGFHPCSDPTPWFPTFCSDPAPTSRVEGFDRFSLPAAGTSNVLHHYEIYCITNSYPSCLSTPDIGSVPFGLVDSNDVWSAVSQPGRDMNFIVKKEELGFAYIDEDQDEEPDEDLSHSYATEIDDGDGVIEFDYPVKYNPGDVIIFKFTGLNYNGLSNSDLDLFQVKYKRPDGSFADPVYTNNNAQGGPVVGYRIEVPANMHGRIDKNSFQWPGAATNVIMYADTNTFHTSVFTNINKSISFSGFGNQRAGLSLIAKQGSERKIINANNTDIEFSVVSKDDMPSGSTYEWDLNGDGTLGNGVYEEITANNAKVATYSSAPDSGSMGSPNNINLPETIANRRKNYGVTARVRGNTGVEIGTATLTIRVALGTYGNGTPLLSTPTTRQSELNLYGWHDTYPVVFNGVSQIRLLWDSNLVFSGETFGALPQSSSQVPPWAAVNYVKIGPRGFIDDQEKLHATIAHELMHVYDYAAIRDTSGSFMRSLLVNSGFSEPVALNYSETEAYLNSITMHNLSYKSSAEFLEKFAQFYEESRSAIPSVAPPTRDIFRSRLFEVFNGVPFPELKDPAYTPHLKSP